MKIAIKGAKASKEFPIKVDGVSLTVGIKVYSVKDLSKIRKEYLGILNTKELNELEDKVALHPENSSLVEELERLSEAKEAEMTSFYRKHILYIKDAVLETDETDLIVSDTRDSQPIEGLWKDDKECLNVLLDLYFDNTSIAPLLTNAVTTVVFNSSYKEENLKN
jgi:hypothetical protein